MNCKLNRLTLTLLLAASPLAWAQQYKVVGADGSVTYTDRPPVTTTAKVTPLGSQGRTSDTAPVGGDANLPFELRQAAARFPVTLYTSAECTPCDSARQFLQQRGVPYGERRVASEEDAAVLERTVGGRTVPSLTIGSQALRGLSQTDWSSYLDAAGYPRESKLPRNWTPPAATPLVERVVPRTEPVQPRARPVPQTAEALPPADPSGVRF